MTSRPKERQRAIQTVATGFGDDDNPRMPRQRKNLDMANLNGRFGEHFRGLLDKSGLTVADLRKRLSMRRHNLTESGIRHWMRGEAFPSPILMEALAEIFNLPDYRDVLPPPPIRRRPQ